MKFNLFIIKIAQITKFVNNYSYIIDIKIKKYFSLDNSLKHIFIFKTKIFAKVFVIIIINYSIRHCLAFLFNY